MKRFHVVYIFYMSIMITGCQDLKRLEDHDPTLRYSKEQYEDMLTGQGPYHVPLNPNLPISPPKIGITLPQEMFREITISVTDQIPLKEVFMELARQAKINIALSPMVQGGVFYQAYKQPAIDVMKELCRIAGLRYRIDNKTVRIEPDTPYMKTYNVESLALSRHKKNRISMATDVFTAMEGYLRDFDNGSSTLLTDESKVDFWQELENNLAHILNSGNVEGVSNYTVHKQAGLVTVYGTQTQHELIKQFLQDVLYSTQLQVLIEAKIVEVNLNDEYQTGINWNHLNSDFKLQAPLGEITHPGPFDPNVIPTRNVFTIGTGGKTLTALASILSQFGTVRTLSSPRVTVLNNQTAVLKVATNEVFFKVNYYREIPTDENPGVERASSQIQTVPIGLVMVVHPAVDVETGRITLTLRPTISRVISEKEDPAVAILSNQAKSSKVPVVAVRELDSVLQMESGDTIVMGGLMEDRSDDEHTGVPGAKDIPIFGHLFGGKTHRHKVSELVIFLRAIVLQLPQIEGADQNVYDGFTRDPRPLVF